MNYENAKDILPEELLRELQKYAAGKLIYVPRDDGRRRWGEASGYRKALRERNRSIIREFADGADADSLADMYYLTPETIRKIVYSKKEKEKMELEKIFELYSDNEPLSYEIYDDVDETKDWGEVWYFKCCTVTFPERIIEINAFQYSFVTPERVNQMARVIEAYRTLGLECPRILENKFGELSRTVNLSGHDCVVYATEKCDYRTPPTENRESKIKREEAMTVTAKIANMHLQGTEGAAITLFDEVTDCYSGNGDWSDEYVFVDLKKHLLGKYPTLSEKYVIFEKLWTDNKKKIEKVWDTLPSSLFCSAVSLEKDGALIGFTDFYDGGKDICVHYLLFYSLNWVTDFDPAIAFEFNDESFAKTVEAVKNDIKTAADIYKFTDEEIAIAPEIFKNVLVCTRFYYGRLWYGDEKTVSDTLDFIIEKLSADYDFSDCMR